MKKLILLLLPLFILSCGTTDGAKNEEKKQKDEDRYNRIERDAENIEETSMITFEDFVFDENDLMKVKSDDGSVIAYYDRIDNKNFNVKSVKVFDSEKNESIILVPVYDTITGSITIHIKDVKNERTGKVELKYEQSFMSVQMLSSVDYFGEPFKYESDYSSAFMGVLYIYSVYFDNRIILFQKSDYTIAGSDISEITADKSFMESNKHDTAVFALVIKLFSEIQMELNKARR